MKNRKLSPSDPQQHRIPDLDIIDLEAQSPLDDARPGASGGSPEEASGLYEEMMQFAGREPCASL